MQLEAICLQALACILHLQLYSAQRNQLPGDKESCYTDCSENNSPYCGSWLHSDNTKQASGIYILNKAYLNLTCSINSLPQPVHIAWMFQENPAADWSAVECSSLRKSRNCRYNEIGEHRATATCLLKIANLEQTGHYQCSGKSETGEITSASASVRVYGISELETVESYSLQHGRYGELEVRVCGNPKPHVTWINTRSKLILPAGEYTEGYSALPLHHVISEHNNTYTPVQRNNFCYTSRLVIGSVGNNDGSFRVVASNSVTQIETTIKARIFGYIRKAANGMNKNIGFVSCFVVASIVVNLPIYL